MKNFEVEECKELPTCRIPENRRDLDSPKAKCLDPSEDGSCDDNECFCPCDCEKNNVAFKTLPADSSHDETLEYGDSLEPEMSLEGSGFEVA
jgi:hypothetical protein